MPSERAFSVQNMIHTKLRNRMGAVKAAKLLFIYINSRALKYKWSLQEKKKQEITWLTLSKEQEIEMENANIESTQAHHAEVDDMELEYSEDVAASAAGGYSEIGDDDVRELVPEVEITKLASWIF